MNCIFFSQAQPGPGQPYAPAGWAGGAYQPWPNQPAPTGVPVTPSDPGKYNFSHFYYCYFYFPEGNICALNPQA